MRKRGNVPDRHIVMSVGVNIYNPSWYPIQGGSLSVRATLRPDASRGDLSRTDTLITQIAQVIQEIRDVRKPIDSDSINNTTVAKLPKSKDPIAQTEHNKLPRQDTSERDGNDGGCHD
jgi:hypothetical protein